MVISNRALPNLLDTMLLLKPKIYTVHRVKLDINGQFPYTNNHLKFGSRKGNGKEVVVCKDGRLSFFILFWQKKQNKTK